MSMERKALRANWSLGVGLEVLVRWATPGDGRPRCRPSYRQLGWGCLLSLAGWMELVVADQPLATSDPPRGAIRLAAPEPEQRRQALTEALTAWNALTQRLSSRATGVVLRKEWELDAIGESLQQAPLDWRTLQAQEASLRRFAPGSLQAELDHLRASLRRLTRLENLAVQTPEVVEQQLEQLMRYAALPTEKILPGEEREIRALFETVCSALPDEADIQRLHRQLSRPNSYLWIDRDTVLKATPTSFSIPIRFATCEQGASIVASGTLHAKLSFSFPPRGDEIALRACIEGNGCVDVRGDRNRLHVQTQLLPRIVAAETARLRSTGIQADSPQVHVDIRSQATRVNLDGLLGKLRLVENLAGRVVTRLLKENEPKISKQLEEAIQKRADEEVQDGIYRIQSLLKSGVWDRVESLGFEPDIHLKSSEDGLRCDTDYSRPTQLGALSYPPPVPHEYRSRLDQLVCVHQSTVNNLVDLLSGIRIDEVTIRSLIEGQFKVSSSDWRQLPTGRIPSAMTLSPSQSLRVDFSADGIDLRLPLAGCEMAGQVVAREAVILDLRYEVDRQAPQRRLRRTRRDLTSETDLGNLGDWNQVIDQIFPASFEPLQRVGSKTASPPATLRYLEIADGWLVHGLGRN
jgi:hypothetical protein